MTNVLLGGLCLGQVFIAMILLAMYSKVERVDKRANKIMLVYQELADRIWKRIWAVDDREGG